MKNNNRAVIAISVMAGIAIIVWRISSTGKSVQIKYLMKNNFTSSNKAALASFGSDYILAWYAAARKGRPTFVVGEKAFNTAGGRALQLFGS